MPSRGTRDVATRPEPPAPWPGGRYRLDRLRIRHLRLLEVIHRCGSLGAAAREMGLSQPAVTLLLRELELLFGTSLVERDVRGGRLTPAGLLALERLQAALASVQRAMEVSQPAAQAPPLRLGCSQVAGIDVLPRALAWLQARSTTIPCSVTEGEAVSLLSDLAAGRLDCVVAWMDESVAAEHPLDLFDIAPLWTGRMQVVAAADHPLVARADVPVDALRAAHWVVPRPGSRTFAAFVRLFVKNGHAAPPVTVECASIHTGMHIVAATRMLTVTPDTVARHYAALGQVAVLRGRATTLGETHASLVCLRENRHLSALERLREALLATAGSRDTG